LTLLLDVSGDVVAYVLKAVERETLSINSLAADIFTAWIGNFVNASHRKKLHVIQMTQFMFYHEQGKFIFPRLISLLLCIR
jgi:hypothetical protein